MYNRRREITGPIFNYTVDLYTVYNLCADIVCIIVNNWLFIVNLSIAIVNSTITCKASIYGELKFRQCLECIYKW